MKARFILLFTFLLGILVGCSTKDLYQEEDDNGKKEEEKGSGKLVSFKFEKANNSKLTKDVELTIYDNGNIAGYLTHEADITSLVPTFVIEKGTFYQNKIEQTSGKATHDFTNFVSYEIVGENGNKKSFNVRLLPYTGLPVVTLHTKSESGIRDKTNWMPTHISIDGMGVFENYSDSAYIRGRGNATWNFPKKAFNMKLFNKDPILGMPKHKRWSFLANWRDRTLLRNDATLYIGQQMDNLDWTPKSQFAEVIFNGEHIGNFQIVEHIRVDKNRVNITEMTSEDIDETTITGGYLLEFDQYWDEVNKFRSKRYNLPVNFKNPDEETLKPEQKTYIEDYINTTENYLKAHDFNHAYEYIDVNSFIDYWIVQAVVGNTEVVGPYSVFCHKDRNGKLILGPLWDFDYSTFSTTERTHYVNGRSTMHFSSWWFNDLFEDPEFVLALKRRFEELKPILVKVPAYIQQQSEYLLKSADLNWKLWPIDMATLGIYLNRDESIGKYQDAIDQMIHIYNGRLDAVETELNKLK